MKLHEIARKISNMPSSYSKKRKCNDDDNDECSSSSTTNPSSHTGGPLRRKGGSAEEWDKALGPSLDSMPPGQLPQVRTVLQRYRAMRIVETKTSKVELARKISVEVQDIWAKSRLPFLSTRVCDKKVEEAIDMWTACHRPGGRMVEEFQSKLDKLLNIAIKPRGAPANEESFLESFKIMLKKTNNPKWETDFKFFVDQYKVGIFTYQMSVFNSQMSSHSH